MKTILNYSFLAYFILFFNHSKIYATQQNDVIWQDIPKETVAVLSNDKIIINDKTNLLDNLLVTYHKCSKEEIIFIDLRISSLKKISELIEDLIVSSQTLTEKKFFLGLNKIVLNKFNYLVSLKKVYKNPNLFSFAFEGVDSLDKDLKPLILINNVSFDVKLPTLWGLYWLEVIDPAHRQLSDYYLNWLQLKIKSPFFLWLENQVVPYYTPSIYYYTQCELGDYLVKVKNGLLFDRNNKLLSMTSSDFEYIYVITMDKKLYISISSPSIRHTSISQGKPVLGSGSIKISNGKIIYFDTESGHYQPNKFHAVQAGNIFNNLNVVHHKCVVKFYDDQIKTIKFDQLMKSVLIEETINRNIKHLDIVSTDRAKPIVKLN